MRVTIINRDDSVTINGKTHSGLDFSKFPENIHAIQWYETYGEVEYVTGADGIKPANEKIDNLEPYNYLLDLWEIAEQEEIAERQRNTPTPEQIAIGKRNNLLVASDWTQLPDVTLTAEKKAEWAAYRQALRDMTSDPNFPNIPFPVKPSA